MRVNFVLYELTLKYRNITRKKHCIPNQREHLKWNIYKIKAKKKIQSTFLKQIMAEAISQDESNVQKSKFQHRWIIPTNIQPQKIHSEQT